MDDKKLIEPFFNNEPSTGTNNSHELIKPMDFDVRTKSVEEKLYIVLYRLDGDDLEEYQKQCFSICIGRTNTLNDIKEKLISGLDIDVHRSIIITETKQTETESGDRKYFLLPYDECISLYSFCVSLKEYYSDDSFDIEDYNNTEVPEKDDIEKLPGYLTAEQLEFKKMLTASFKRDKFLNEMRQESQGEDANI